MEVSAPPGNVIGTIEQEWSILPKFKVKDISGDVILRIEVGTTKWEQLNVILRITDKKINFLMNENKEWLSFFVNN